MSTVTMTAETGSGRPLPSPPLFLPIRHVVRVTVEAVTPISPSSGEVDAELDAPLFRDWNGLPCLSGTTVAGVIRSAYADYFGNDECKEVFGYEQARDQAGQASRLLVSFGLAHGADDRPVEDYLDPGGDDPVIALLRRDAPVLRDHVAIDDRGVADENKLFDRVSCPAGTRFTLELAVDGESADEARRRDRSLLLRAVALIESPGARFGGAGRRGLGRLVIVRDGGDPRVFHAPIDRHGPKGRMRWEAYRASGLGDAPAAAGFARVAAGDLALGEVSARRPVTGQLRLKASGFWRIGQGAEPWLPRPAQGENAKNPDVAPPMEPVIVWEGGRGKVKERMVAPVAGSAVKGAIAHRTEFHLRRIRSVWSADQSEIRLADVLFGGARGAATGRAGAFLIDDVFVDFSRREATANAGRRVRNSIDRHTGGVRLGKLFTDEALFDGPELVVPFVLLACSPSRGSDGRWQLAPTDGDAVKALAWALDDLCRGRLALGAREGTGDGVFTGRITDGDGETELDLVAAWAAAARDRAGAEEESA
jgi:hypothetical protein